MGRMFDAVASLIGVRQQVFYEAQAAMEMEALALRAFADNSPGLPYSFGLGTENAEPGQVVTHGEMFREICADLQQTVPREIIALRFHQTVVAMIRKVCESIRDSAGVNSVGLTGGVFQNALLLKLTKAELRKHGFQVLTHQVVPPNDGGIALGQVIAGRAIASASSGRLS